MPDALDQIIRDLSRLDARARTGSLDEENATKLAYQEFGTERAPTGAGANDFESMRLGPASLTRGVSAWAAASPADADLAKTGAGQLFLSLRARYVMPFFCG